MEFDKSRVYTALNADELKVGSRVIVADDLAHLKEFVRRDECICVLKDINSECAHLRFNIKDFALSYALAYLVSEPEPEESGLKWTDLKLLDKIRSKDGIKEGIITRIDRTDEHSAHVFCGGWVPDVRLKEWEKVEE